MLNNNTLNVSDFQTFLTVKRGLSRGYIVAQTSKLNQYLQWLKENNLSINKASAEAFLSQHQAGVGTINNYIYFFKTLELYLKDRGTIIDLATGFKVRKQERPPIEILSVEEVKRLINTTIIYRKHSPALEKTDKMYQVFTEALYLTCARLQEIASLKVRFVDLGNGTITLTNTKGKKYRIVPIQEPLISHLKPYLIGKTDNDLVFTNYVGHNINSNDYWYNLNTRANQAGITRHLHPHILRHSGASHLIMAGVPIEIVSQILGHAEVSTTFSNYVHLKDEQLRNAMFQMPFYKENTPPKLIIDNLLRVIKGLKLDQDYRFNFKIEEMSNELSFRLSIR